MAVLTAVEFRVQNFRNIDDSGWIDLANVTALVGRNESGKSALLKALHKFNPAVELPYNPQREFPRDRFTSEFKDGGDWPVCSVRFNIDEETRAKLRKLCGGQEAPATITYTRFYDGSLEWELDPDPETEPFTASALLDALDAFRDDVMKLAAPDKEQEEKYAELRTTLLSWTDGWIDQLDAHESLKAEEGRASVKTLREEANKKAQPETADILKPLMSRLTEIAKEAEEPDLDDKIADELEEHLPVFIYFDNYGVLDSAIYLRRFIEDLKRDPESPRIRTVNAMFKHVNLTAQEILDLGKSECEDARRAGQEPSAEMIRKDKERVDLRGIKLNSASLDITNRFSKWWRQRRHAIKYTADGDYFRIWVADDRRPGVDIELESRSAGFQWFFSFYLVFLVESGDGHEQAVLLLDEPGLHLHPTAQQELIAFFEELSKRNQLVYSTHSPFLIDGEHIERVRPVTEDETGHSRISNDTWPRDRETIFPLQAAAGYAMVRGLFRHKKNILVEGMSEYFYLHTLSLACRAKEKESLPEDIYITPCGGTKLVGSLASLFLGQEVRPLILLDNDDAGRIRKNALMKQLYSGYENAILLLGEALEKEECEIEDLIGEKHLLAVVNTMVPSKITLTDAERSAGSLPDQVEAAAARLSIELPQWWKADAARMIAIKWSEVEKVPDDVLDRAANLFAIMKARFDDFSQVAV